MRSCLDTDSDPSFTYSELLVLLEIFGFWISMMTYICRWLFILCLFHSLCTIPCLFINFLCACHRALSNFILYNQVNHQCTWFVIAIQNTQGEE